MNAAHLHLILNHFPIGGIILGLMTILISIRNKNLTLARMGLSVLVLAGLITIPTYVSGGEAEEVVEKLPGISENFIEIHKEMAEKTIWLIGASSIAAFAALITSWKKKTVPYRTLYGVAIAATGAIVLLARTNQLGAEISHPETRQQKTQDAHLEN